MMHDHALVASSNTTSKLKDVSAQQQLKMCLHSSNSGDHLYVSNLTKVIKIIVSK